MMKDGTKAAALRSTAALVCILQTVRAVTLSGSVGPGQKVTVRVYGEAGCRFTRQYLSGPVRNALSDPQTAQVMDFDFSPFGNAYFLTRPCQEAAVSSNEPTGPGCGGGDGYSPSMRSCFNRMCGPGATSRPAECFKGPLLCQHGFKECAFDRYFACAKRVARPSFLPFVLCMVDRYPETDGGDPFSALLASCANASGAPLAALRSCYGGAEGTAALAAEAAATPEHPGVPYVTVNGYAMEETYEPQALRAAVKSARGGAAPPAGAALAGAPTAQLRQLRPAELRERGDDCDESGEEAWRG